MFEYQLKNIEVWLHLGATPEERAEKQKILVHFKFEFDGSKSAETDNVEDTQDYFLVQQYIKNFAGKTPFALLEKLHTDLLAALKKTFPKITPTELSIEKFPFTEGSIILKG